MNDKTERFEMRVPSAFLKAIDEWRRKQTDLPSRSEAIRRLVEQALGAEPSGRTKPDQASRAATASRAEKVAGKQIDRVLERSGQPDDVKAQRKRRLTKVPAELRKPLKS